MDTTLGETPSAGATHSIPTSLEGGAMTHGAAAFGVQLAMDTGTMDTTLIMGTWGYTTTAGVAL